MRRIAMLLATLLLAISVAACTSSKPEKVAGSNTPAAGEAKPETKPESKGPEIFKVGDTIKTGKMTLTVNNVRFTPGEGFFKAKDGMTYLVVEATIENISNDTVPVSSLMMFSAADKDGHNYNITLFTSDKGQLDGQLPATRKMRGEVAFEVPKDSKGLELLFLASPLDKEPAIIALGDAQ